MAVGSYYKVHIDALNLVKKKYDKMELRNRVGHYLAKGGLLFPPLNHTRSNGKHRKEDR